jgi:hypothetical protein
MCELSLYLYSIVTKKKLILSKAYTEVVCVHSYWMRESDTRSQHGRT